MFEILFALLPMVILVISMGICKWPGDKSSLLTLVITVMLAIFAFGIPAQEIGFTLINSTARACITILSVIWMAVFSYNILLDSGKIKVLKDQLATISTDRSVQVLLITWGFGGLLEGMPGYGTSVAIPAAILVTLGFRPLFAVLASLIANSEPTTFGAVGIAETVLMEETGCPLPELCKATIQQLYPFIFLIPITLAILADRRRQANIPSVECLRPYHFLYITGYSLQFQGNEFIAFCRSFYRGTDTGCNDKQTIHITRPDSRTNPQYYYYGYRLGQYIRTHGNIRHGAITGRHTHFHLREVLRFLVPFDRGNRNIYHG